MAAAEVVVAMSEMLPGPVARLAAPSWQLLLLLQPMQHAVLSPQQQERHCWRLAAPILLLVNVELACPQQPQLPQQQLLNHVDPAMMVVARAAEVVALQPLCLHPASYHAPTLPRRRPLAAERHSEPASVAQPEAPQTATDQEQPSCFAEHGVALDVCFAALVGASFLAVPGEVVALLPASQVPPPGLKADSRTPSQVATAALLPVDQPPLPCLVPDQGVALAYLAQVLAQEAR